MVMSISLNTGMVKFLLTLHLILIVYNGTFWVNNIEWNELIIN